MTQKIRVLHFSSHDEDCGVAKYQELFLQEMTTDTTIENRFFDSSPYKTRLMDDAELDEVAQKLTQELSDYDILHIQHEFGMYGQKDFAAIIRAGKASGKKVIVTLHLSPAVVDRKVARSGLGPRSIVHYLRGLHHERLFQRRFAKPLSTVDLIIVHNESTKRAVEQLGISESRIKKITIPVPEVKQGKTSTEIKQNLKVKSGDVVYATIGFLHKYKGITQAIKALKYLPDNYKLAVIGGVHQTSDHVGIYDKIADLVRDLGLIDRVYITGFRESDDDLNALIQEVDVCVYPYDRKYYSNVSSASLNNAFANKKPVIAYPTQSFKEIQSNFNALDLTDTFSYYELVRSLKKLDVKDAAKRSEGFAKAYSYENGAQELVGIYNTLI